MLTTEQKETILRKAGVAVPAFPCFNLSDQEPQADARPILKENRQADGRQDAAAQWARTIDALFVEFSAARAAGGLRDAEEIRQLDRLRQASDNSPA